MQNYIKHIRSRLSQQLSAISILNATCKYTAMGFCIHICYAPIVRFTASKSCIFTGEMNVHTHNYPLMIVRPPILPKRRRQFGIYCGSKCNKNIILPLCLCSYFAFVYFIYVTQTENFMHMTIYLSFLKYCLFNALFLKQAVKIIYKYLLNFHKALGKKKIFFKKMFVIIFQLWTESFQAAMSPW